MRLKQQISACSRGAAAIALTLCLFTSGRQVFAIEQQAPGAVPAVQNPPTQVSTPGAELQITADDAVRMALENNLGIRAERLSPQVQALALEQTRASYAPLLFSNTTKNSNSNPPSNFLSGTNFVTNGGFRANAGVQ